MSVVAARAGDGAGAIRVEARPGPRRSEPEQDALEREADRVADAALAGSRPIALRPSTAPAARAAPAPTAPDVTAARAVAASSGAPLSLATRAYFEPRLGRDLSPVRVLPDLPAAERIGARAFAYGHAIGFAPGEYAPTTADGRALLAHELAHVVQQQALGAPRVQRKDKRKEADAKEKPKIIAIAAQQGALVGEATLSTDGAAASGTATVKLTQNALGPGTHKLVHIGQREYRESPETSKADMPSGFRWVVPWLDEESREAKYDWADEVVVTITQSAQQRIASLPPHIRRLLTTDTPGAAPATEAEIEAVAEAGELLARGGFTEAETLLLEEKMRRDRELGHSRQEEPESVQFALNLLAARAKTKADREHGFSDLTASAKALAKDPLHIIRHGGLETLLDPGSDAVERANVWNMLRFHIKEGSLPERTPGVDLEQVGRGLLHGFRARLLAFEKALVADIGRKGAVALNDADAALLRMDRAFTGFWQPTSPPPDYFWRHLMNAREAPVVRQATALRDAARKEIEQQEDRDRVPMPGLGGALSIGTGVDFNQALGGGPMQDVTRWNAYLKRQKQRDAQRQSIDKAYEAVVRESTGLKLPPNADVAAILHASDPDDAIIRLRNWLYYGRGKIREAHGKLGDRQFIFKADIWIEAEKKDLKAVLGGEGTDIAILVDAFASVRKSETSFWDELLKVVQFVAMFVPGPIGWGLRATTAFIAADKRMGELADKRTLYTVGGGSVDATAWDAFEVLVELAMDVAPDLPAAKAASSRRGLGLSDDATRAGEEATERAGKSATDAAEDSTRHADATAPPRAGAKPPPDAAAANRHPAADEPHGSKQDGSGQEPEHDVRGEVKQDRNILIRAEEDMNLLKVDDLRARRQELHKARTDLSRSVSAAESDIARLEDHIETLREKHPNRSTKAAEDNLAKFEKQAADERAALQNLDADIAAVENDIAKLSPAKPPPAPQPGPPAPGGALGTFPTQDTVKLQGTQMDSRFANVYVGVRQKGYRPNVETLLQKDPDGPLSKALLGADGKIIEWNHGATLANARADRRVFVAGHAYSSHAAQKHIANAGERDFIILTSDYRNRKYNIIHETGGAGERMSDFAYVIQGIAVEPGTAWDLVHHHGLPANVVEGAPRIRLVQ